uniref:Uncharacterized protein n=1 Tax=Romanomermis culicivorax TaxID=13658 RepID=A0A915IHI9_ROMCU
FGGSGLTSGSPKLLSSVNYYHYYVPREEVEELLTTLGDFLVRAIITKEAKIAVILSVRGKDKIEHFVADYKPLENEVGKGMFYFIKSVGRPSLPDLVEYHMNKKVAVNGFVLKRPVGRRNYEILNNRVKFDGTRILGEGNFAVVTKGTFNVLATNTVINVACKRIRVEKCKSQFDKLEAKRQIVREVHIGRILQGHPHILSIYGMFVETEELAVISELCD